MKKPNDGVRAYQEAKRQETLSKIDEAYTYLKETHQIITKAAIARTCGMSPKTINKPFVQAYLSNYEEFRATASASSESVEELKLKICSLNNKLEKTLKANSTLRAENTELKLKCKSLAYDYECLLGDYQKAGEQKLIKL